jgi:hypothetical protein
LTSAPAALSDLGVVVAGSGIAVHVLGGDGASVTSGGRAAGHRGGAPRTVSMRRISFAELGRTGRLPVRPWLLPGEAVLGRAVHGLDAGEDEIDASARLLPSPP